MDLLSSMLTTLRLDASIFLHSSFCQEWVIDINAIDEGTFHLISHPVAGERPGGVTSQRTSPGVPFFRKTK